MDHKQKQMVFASDTFAGKLVVITGAGTGIGRSTAVRFGKLGAIVCLIGRRPGPLQEVAGLIGDHAHVYPADICDEGAVRSVVSDIYETHGPIHCLVNNAGGQKMQPSETVSAERIQATMSLNVGGTWNMMRAVFLQSMKKHGGSIVTVSAALYAGFPLLMCGAAARAAVSNMSQTVSVEWARHGVRVNTVSPGFIFSNGLNSYPKAFQAYIGKVHSRMPAGRCGTESEVCDTIVFLSSGAAAYTTGSDVRVDGGAQQLHGFHSAFLRNDKPFPAYDHGLVAPTLPPALQTIYETYQATSRL